jgi:ribosomal protein S18 acetylase RimI-like enzyme
MKNVICLQQGFTDEQRHAAAALYDAAFSAKLGVAIPDPKQRLSILTQGFQPKFCWVAMRDEELVGIAGYKNAQGSLTGGISWRLLQTELGYRGALRALAILALLDRDHTPGELLLDGICVAANMRGQGVGSQLLQQLIQYAEREGYQRLRLDVVNTNPDAKRLYQRMGFNVTAIESFAYLKCLLGFSAADKMEYLLEK